MVPDTPGRPIGRPSVVSDTGGTRRQRSAAGVRIREMQAHALKSAPP